MAKLDVLNWDKKSVGNVEIPDAVFEKGVKPELLHTMVRWQLVSRRQGTHATKTKGLVSGGGKKPFKQKGTGGARAGSNRSPLWPGGGTMFGPQPKSYAYTLPSSMKKSGLKAALTYLYNEKKLFVVDEMTSKEGKTKELASRLKKFGLTKALLVSNESDENFNKAARNLPKFRYNTAAGLNVYDMLRFDALILSKDAVQEIVKRCGVE